MYGGGGGGGLQVTQHLQLKDCRAKKPLKLQVWDDAVFTCKSGNEELQASTLAMRVHVCEAMSSGVHSVLLCHTDTLDRQAKRFCHSPSPSSTSATTLPLLPDPLRPLYLPPSPSAHRRHLTSVQICGPDTALVLMFHVRVALPAQSIAH